MQIKIVSVRLTVPLDAKCHIVLSMKQFAGVFIANIAAVLRDLSGFHFN